MLLELKVINFAIIDNVHIQFRSGLNILSGETGAGKSILLKSLGLLMGEKASVESVRSGAENAVIEGSFDISSRPDIRERLRDMGVEDTAAPGSNDEQMIVRRIVSTVSNKSRVYINGALSTLANLREVVSPLVEVAGHPAAPLIEMTGQHENRNLLSRAYHLDLLDQYSGVWKLRPDFANDFRKAQQLSTEIEKIRHESRARAQRLDFLIYQRDEIRALGLEAGEEERIESETKRLKHSARLTEFVEQAENLLFNDEGSVSSRLHFVLNRASDLRGYDPQLVEKLGALAQAKAMIDDIGYEFRNYAKSLDADPGRLDALEARLSALRLLQKKYGSTAAEILQALAAIEAEIGELENSDEWIESKERELEALEKDLCVRAQDMHKRRMSGAKLLADGVAEELKDLNMKGVGFLVHVVGGTSGAAQMTSTGLSTVEFMTRSSKSDSPRSLAKFASGGELSRILLAVKQVVGAGHFPRTYLFDEVDTGVSGPTAEKVGRKLKRMAKGQQVVCVTHLPQVASCGDIHFSIRKSGGKKTVQTEVVELSRNDRVQEIARLISGEKITKTSLAHAEQLLSSASL